MHCHIVADSKQRFSTEYLVCDGVVFWRWAGCLYCEYVWRWPFIKKYITFKPLLTDTDWSNDVLGAWICNQNNINYVIYIITRNLNNVWAKPPAMVCARVQMITIISVFSMYTCYWCQVDNNWWWKYDQHYSDAWHLLLQMVHFCHRIGRRNPFFPSDPHLSIPRW